MNGLRHTYKSGERKPQGTSIVKAGDVLAARFAENVRRIAAEGFLEDRLVIGDVTVLSSEVFLQLCTRSIDTYRSTRPRLSNVGESAPDNACMHLQLYYDKLCSAKLHACERVTSVEMHVVSMSSPF